MKTLLYSWHKNAGARFAPFASYDMPIQYGGAVEEHRLCRRSLGLFDIDHMGRLLLSGPGAGEALSSLVSQAVLDMEGGEARYSLLLNDEGGIIDDLFIYRLNENSVFTDPWFVVLNAGNKEKDSVWLGERIPGALTLTDTASETCMIAVQGPRAVELLDSLGPGGRETAGPSSGFPAFFTAAPGASSFSALPRNRLAFLTLGGIPLLAGRTGYTGEDGAELFCPGNRALELWELLLEEAEKAGMEAGPVGLAARDSLRFEAGMPLHGHEIAPSITPLEALLSWACDFSKDFTGKDALLRQKAAGIKRKLVTLTITGGVPREGYAVLDGTGAAVGTVAAGMFCPSTGTYSANAFVPPELAGTGTKLAVEIRGSPKAAEVVKRPLYIPAYRRKTP